MFRAWLSLKVSFPRGRGSTYLVGCDLVVALPRFSLICSYWPGYLIPVFVIGMVARAGSSWFRTGYYQCTIVPGSSCRVRLTWLRLRGGASCTRPDASVWLVVDCLPVVSSGCASGWLIHVVSFRHDYSPGFDMVAGRVLSWCDLIGSCDRVDRVGPRSVFVSGRLAVLLVSC